MVNPDLAIAKLKTNAGLKKFTGAAKILALSGDPERHLLTEHEIAVAETLSLTGQKYLLTRGQILRGYVENLKANQNGKHGENWNKTAAQKVCNIDVNKASQLFQIFMEVGWFNAQHYQHHLTTQKM